MEIKQLARRYETGGSNSSIVEDILKYRRAFVGHYDLSEGRHGLISYENRFFILDIVASNLNILRSTEGGTRWCIWLRHCATSRKIAGSIPVGVIGIFL